MMTLDVRRTQFLSELGIPVVWHSRAEPSPSLVAELSVSEQPQLSTQEVATLVPPLLAEPGAVSSLDLVGLAAQVSTCTACNLCKGRTQTVFGVGDPNASWMLIGEAPGAEEDARGEPFVGQAGRLLDNMLTSLRMRRGEGVYIANVLKCRPPHNRNPQPEEVNACEPFLRRQIELIQPRIIVVLGRFAAQSLLGTDATIASLRGKVHAYAVSGRSIPVVVTYHPAYLLRNLPDKAKAWADLCFAQKAFNS